MRACASWSTRLCRWRGPPGADKFDEVVLILAYAHRPDTVPVQSSERCLPALVVRRAKCVRKAHVVMIVITARPRPFCEPTDSRFIELFKAKLECVGVCAVVAAVAGFIRRLTVRVESWRPDAAEA